MENNSPSLDREKIVIKPEKIGELEQFNNNIGRHDFKRAREIVENDGIQDLNGAERSLDATIVKSYKISKPSEGKPFTAEEVEMERKKQLGHKVAEYGIKHNLDYQTNEILDELLAALDEAVDQADMYRLKSSREKAWGIPIITSIQKLLQTRRFKNLLTRIEGLYNNIPDELKNRRYIDLVNKDKVSARYGKGDKASLIGEAVGIGGLGASGAGYGLLTASAVVPGIGLGLIVGGGLTALVGGITKFVGEYKSIESDKHIDQTIAKLCDFRQEVIGLKQGIPPNTFQRSYTQTSLTNLETSFGGTTSGSFGTAAAGGIAGGITASAMRDSN